MVFLVDVCGIYSVCSIYVMYIVYTCGVLTCGLYVSESQDACYANLSILHHIPQEHVLGQAHGHNHLKDFAIFYLFYICTCFACMLCIYHVHPFELEWHM